MSVAIDFTASNGEPSDANSLHKINYNGEFNHYEKAIKSVGNILDPYAYENKFAVFGFGGVPKFTGSSVVSHCFNLSGVQDPTVKGLDSLLNTYRERLKQISLSGPTYFSPTLNVLLQYMKATMHLQMYHILLILTDGVIHDMRETKDLIVQCAHHPLSIIIVGIGKADFSMMVELDGDDEIIRNQRGEAAIRDIVQFVEFDQFINGDLGVLAEEVLKEVPDQLVGYMV